jgi:hypothetical protein
LGAIIDAMPSEILAGDQQEFQVDANLEQIAEEKSIG